MNCTFLSISSYPVIPLKRNLSRISRVAWLAKSNAGTTRRKKLPKNPRYPRRSKLPPDLGVNLFLKKPGVSADPCKKDSSIHGDTYDSTEEEEDEEQEQEHEGGDIVWEPDEIEAISSLFQGRIPQKPGKLNRERPLPLPLPYKLRPLGLPTPKKRIKPASEMVSSSRAGVSKLVYKNPSFLIGLAREIKGLASDEEVCLVLNKWGRFLRKGSLSLTIRELGHMGLPERALRTLCWAQKQPHLFPDDRILASTVEVLARHHDLKMPFNLEKFVSLARKGVMEAMVKGFIRGGSLNLAWKLLVIARDGKRMLDPCIYAKLIWELGKNPDKYMLVESLLDELGEREDLNLTQQDCTAIMKVCTRIRKFDIVESLFDWFKHSGKEPSVVMYTTLIHSCYLQKKYREALAIVWEMEASHCLFDLPAYRVAIKVFVALNDLSRAVRYFSKLKEAGFSPTYDIYRQLINIYLVSGRLAKCREVCKELEAAGFKLDKHALSRLLELERVTRLGF